MSDNKTKVAKTLIYENEAWNLKISTYPFEVKRVDEGWTETKETLKLVEISKTKKMWSDEIKWYFEKKSFVTLWLSDFKHILKTIKVEAI